MLHSMLQSKLHSLENSTLHPMLQWKNVKLNVAIYTQIHPHLNTTDHMVHAVVLGSQLCIDEQYTSRTGRRKPQKHPSRSNV